MRSLIFFAFFVVIIACAIVVLAIAALLRNPAHYKNRTFTAFSLTLAAWMVSNYFGSNTNLPGITELLVRTDFAVGAFLTMTLFVFATSFYPDSKSWLRSKRFLYGMIGLATLLFIGSYADQVVEVHLINGELWYPERSLFIPYTITGVSYLVAGIVVLIVSRMKVKGVERMQLNFVLTGLGFTAVLAGTPNLILPNFVENEFVRNLADNMAFLGIFVFAASSAYAIIRYRLYDLRIIVARSVAYVLLMATLGLVYGFVVFGVSSLLFSSVFSFIQLGTYAFIAVVLALTVQPLKRFFDRLTNSIFYRDAYQIRDVLDRLSDELVAEIDLDQLIEKSLATFFDTLRPTHARLIVLVDDRVFRMTSTGRVKKLPQSFVKVLLASEERHHLFLEDDETDLRAHLQSLNTSVALKLVSKKQVQGVLLLGPRRNGGVYNAQDIELLSIGAKNLALAINNAKNYDEVQRFNVTLQEKVDAATRKLRLANVRLKKLDLAKDDFISMASHQLRPQLTAGKGFVSMLREGVEGPLSKGQREMLALTEESINRMVDIVSDMLDLSRINTGKMHLDLDRVDVKKIVLDEVGRLRTKAKDKNIAITVKTPKRVPSIKADGAKLKEVSMNFITNAIQYSSAKSEVQVTIRVRQASVEVMVADNGIGVPEASQKSLFTKFYRADNARKKRPSGTGIGLFVAKTIVEAHGGEIVFESTEGVGSLFGFRLPL